MAYDLKDRYESVSSPNQKWCVLFWATCDRYKSVSSPNQKWCVMGHMWLRCNKGLISGPTCFSVYTVHVCTHRLQRLPDTKNTWVSCCHIDGWGTSAVRHNCQNNEHLFLMERSKSKLFYEFCPSLRLVNFIPTTPFTALKIMLKHPEHLASSW